MLRGWPLIRISFVEILGEGLTARRVRAVCVFGVPQNPPFCLLSFLKLLLIQRREHLLDDERGFHGLVGLMGEEKTRIGKLAFVSH
jgi:hypothetical protein